jgi:hypothetical protein
MHKKFEEKISQIRPCSKKNITGIFGWEIFIFSFGKLFFGKKSEGRSNLY